MRERTRATDGTFHPRPLAAPTVDGRQARWVVESEWRGPDGTPLLDEAQRWSLRDARAHLVLDLEWTLHARRGITFGECAYGGIFLRMPYREEHGGTVLTSHGQNASQAAGQRARWVAVSMPIAGRPDRDVESRIAGIAILDHPSNPEHPVPWRIDGQLGISPSRCIAGAWCLSTGESATERYRLVAFGGPIDPAYVDACWRTYATERTPESDAG